MRRPETYRPAARDAARRAMAIARKAGERADWRDVWAQAKAARAALQKKKRPPSGSRKP